MAGTSGPITHVSGPFTVLLAASNGENRTPVNEAQSGSDGDHLEPAINDGPNLNPDQLRADSTQHRMECKMKSAK